MLLCIAWQTTVIPKPTPEHSDVGSEKSGDTKLTSAEAAAAWMKDAEAEVNTSDAHSRAVQAAAVSSLHLFYMVSNCF